MNRWKRAFFALVIIILVAFGAVAWLFTGLSSAQDYAEAMLTDFANQGVAASRPPLFPSEYLTRGKLENLQMIIRKTGSITNMETKTCFSLINYKTGCGLRYFRCSFEGTVEDGRFSATVALCPNGSAQPDLMGIRWNIQTTGKPSAPEQRFPEQHAQR